ncbi:MAG: hypothetical protein HY554_05315, partial [Elusimicrobia bacterium]|nr:hypothetical protein [Elusimicrobiota bacterium]
MRPWLFVGLFLAGFAEASSAGARGRAPAVSPARFAAAVGSQLGAIASLPAPVAIERLEVSVGSPAEAAAAAAIIGAAAYHQRYLPAAIATLQAAEGDGGKAAQALEGWAQRAFDERAVFEARDALARMARLPARVEALFDGGRRRRPEDPDRSAGEWLEFFGSLRLYQAVDFAGLKLHEEAVRR